MENCVFAWQPWPLRRLPSVRVIDEANTDDREFRTPDYRTAFASRG
jgi:hypothetical protein